MPHLVHGHTREIPTRALARSGRARRPPARCCGGQPVLHLLYTARRVYRCHPLSRVGSVSCVNVNVSAHRWCVAVWWWGYNRKRDGGDTYDNTRVQENEQGKERDMRWKWGWVGGAFTHRRAAARARAAHPPRRHQSTDRPRPKPSRRSVGSCGWLAWRGWACVAGRGSCRETRAATRAAAPG